MARVIRRLLLAATAALASSSAAQDLVEWTESAGRLGLGYPVPIPVDTPLPFDGFRTYAGLRARHEQLALDTGLLRRAEIGTTTAGRPIYAWRLGDADALTVSGLPEPATLVQGTIHAREWQAPEVVTGFLEWVLERRDDQSFHQYLLENVNMVVVPVLNVDGFLQTQRWPSRNYIGEDPTAPSTWPRDGRMRRKNMRSVDEDLFTVADHLLGIDLNRNNPPFWATSGSSSALPESLLHHGTGPHSEPETRAMTASAELGPADRLRVYTDVHSFGQVFFSERGENPRTSAITAALLGDLTEHQLALPGAKRYLNSPSAQGAGIGSTDEYFSVTYGIPSWTLEIEPANGGVDYGGLGTNGHDGFILPESEIRRVRDNLAQMFVITYLHQAGPPAVRAVRITDADSGAAVYDAEWDVVDPSVRALHQRVLQPLRPDRDYVLWVGFDKPMRWREGGEVAALPGQPAFGLRVNADLHLDGRPLRAAGEEPGWLSEAGGAGRGYLRYRDDAFAMPLRVAAGELPDDEADAVLEIRASDPVGLRTDADPSTVVDWADGHWVGYEGDDGAEGDDGGTDATLAVPLRKGSAPPPFLAQPGSTAAYFDPSRSGEGFLLEVLEDGVANVYWFTYDEAGGQRWYTGTGEIRGNEVVFETLFVAAGGVFGAAFDASRVLLEPVGRLSLLFEDCDRAGMRFAPTGGVHRQELARLTRVAGPSCGASGVELPAATITGSWYDPARSGEGFVVQELEDGRALVYWFTYDLEGRQAWFFGEGVLDAQGRVFVQQTLVTRGGRFGDAFDPADVLLDRWGEMRFDFDCDTATMSYADTPPGFGSGTFSLVRLTRPAGTRACP